MVSLQDVRIVRAPIERCFDLARSVEAHLAENVQVVMIRGPFRFMRHDHFFRALPGGETELRNVFSFAAPVPVLGRVAEMTFLRRYMMGLLRERNAVTREIAESADWPRYLNP